MEKIRIGISYFKDEYGKDFTICFDAFEFLEWIDTEQIAYIKEQVKKHVDSK